MQISRKIFDVEDFRIFFLRLNNMKVESVGKRMTTIGRQLQKFRMLLGLSQTEMAASIVTESFYSKVERDKSAITIDKLVALLNKHEISLYDFFNVFDQENLPQLILHKKMYEAFDNRDLEKLKQLHKSVKEKSARLKLELMITDIEEKVAQLPLITKEELEGIAPQLDFENLDDFWNLAIFMPLFSFEKATKVINGIEGEFKQLDFADNQITLSLMNLFIAYLNRCYKEDHSEEARRVISLAQQVPRNFMIFHQIIIHYYQALFNKDGELAKRIIDLLKESGYQNYVTTLPKVGEMK